MSKGGFFTKGVVFNEREWDWYARNWGLTKREIDVVRMMCQGCSYEQTARGLGLKYNTVRALMGRVYKRMGTNNRQGVIIALLERLAVMGEEGV